MNISHQNTDNLNAVISIEISKADYQEKVDKSLRAYGQKANIPGFRKGKVPFSMLMKMFGKSVRVEEINRLVSESLYNYIRDNKLNLGRADDRRRYDCRFGYTRRFHVPF